MGLEYTPEAVLSFAKARVYLISTWPPTSSVSRLQLIWFNIRWWISIIFLLCLFFPLLNGIFVYRSDTLIVIKAVCLNAATLQALIKLLISRYQWKRLKMLHMEMENFLKIADTSERQYIQIYINKGAAFLLFFTVSTWLVCLALYIEPIVLSQSFPTDASYPFNIDNPVLHNILYAQQAIAIFLIASGLSVDTQVAILIWFTCARFDMIGQQFEKVNNEAELKSCIQQHQKILEYADQVRKSIRYIAVGTIVTTTIGVICGLLTVISPQPLAVKIHVAAIVGDAATELLIYSWPADDLIQSQEIGRKAYSCNWVGQSQAMKRSLQTVIQRAQKPVLITVAGIIPGLSLQYYTNFLSTTFSIFTKIRIIFADDGP